MPAELLPLLHKLMGLVASLLVAFGAVATIDFTEKITLGSILTTVIVVAIAGVFTIRSKIANIWREEAEGERAAKERLQDQLAEEKADRADFERQQQELRHDLKDELAGCKAALAVAEAKTDLTAALEAIKQMNESTVSVISHAITETLHETSALSERRDSQTHKILSEIRDKLPSEPITVVDVTDDAHPA